MARRASNQPTEVEMDILNVLWELGPATLGEVHDAMTQRRDVSYSTTRKMTQVMREKGLIQCSDHGKPLRYSAAKSQKQTQLALINDLIKRAFAGNAKDLMLSLLSSKQISDDDLVEINRMIKSERKKNNG